jgi:multidrug efflux pump subunit AcrA (membrane-fusion protein)
MFLCFIIFLKKKNNKIMLNDYKNNLYFCLFKPVVKFEQQLGKRLVVVVAVDFEKQQQIDEQQQQKLDEKQQQQIDEQQQLDEKQQQQIDEQQQLEPEKQQHVL